MKEEFVSFEQAQALKECGFDWKCQFYYTQEDAPKGEVWFTANVARLDYNNMHDNEGNLINYIYSAPTLTLAQKWLRDVKDVDIDIRTDFIGRRQYDYVIIYKQTQYFANKSFSTYEETLASGLDKALKLIKEK